MSIKYYHLAKDETPPEEFCVIKDVGGEPSEYTFYVLEDENAKLRQQLANVIESMGRVEERCAKLRELAENLKACNSSCGRCIELFGKCDYEAELRELGIEVNDA